MFIKRKLKIFSLFLLIATFIILVIIFSPSKTNPIILITIDTIRADYLGAYGGKFHASPNIDRLAKESILFENCFSPVPMTLPSHISILTGVYPNRHGVYGNGLFKLKKNIITISKLFHNKGYKTIAAVASYVLNSRYGLAEGFDVYKDQMMITFDIPSQNAQIRADEVNKRVIEVLNNVNSKKIFLWVHYFDPHLPYDPPAEFRKKFKNPYAGEIAFVDQQLNLLLQYLKEKRIYEKALIIIIGDHGEGLGEHQERGHGYFLYNTTLKVPFIMKFPFNKYKKLSISEKVSTIDIFPTLCDFFKFKCDEFSLQGSSLIPLITKKRKYVERRFYAFTKLPEIDFGWAPLSAIIKDNWKYVDGPSPELFDLLNDDYEKNNIYPMNPKIARKLKKELDAWINSEKNYSVSAELKADKDSIEKLKSLGYISGTLSVKNKNLYVDVRDMKITIEALNYSNDLLMKGKPFEAIAILEKEINRLEEIKKPASFLYGLAAQFYATVQNYDKAIVYYKKFLSLLPNYPDHYLALAKIYNIKGNPAEAISYLYQALKIDPDIVEAYIMLGNNLVDLNKFNEAEKVFKIGLSHFPNDYNLLISYSRLLTFSENYDEAITNLRKAIQLQPTLPEAYINICLVYYYKKDYQKAKEELQNLLNKFPNNPTALEIQKELIGKI